MKNLHKINRISELQKAYQVYWQSKVRYFPGNDTNVAHASSFGAGWYKETLSIDAQEYVIEHWKKMGSEEPNYSMIEFIYE